MNENKVKNVSAGLAIGIFLIPLIFCWFTLEKGYSIASRVISFGWAFLILIINISIFSAASAVTSPNGIIQSETNNISQTDNTVYANVDLKTFWENKNPFLYKDKIVKITGGTITVMKYDSVNRKPYISVELVVPGLMNDFYQKCYLSEVGVVKASKLKIGDKISIIGEPNNEGVLTVLNNCHPE